MALSDAIKAEAEKKPGPKCSTCLLVETIPLEDRHALDAALGDLSITTAAICRALAVEGYKVRPENLQRHRNRDCNRP